VLKAFNDQYMRPDEFAAGIGKSIPTLYRWWREGSGPKASKIGD
jgi:predicted DNA-binding transcriptional regulator AlpA